MAEFPKNDLSAQLTVCRLEESEDSGFSVPRALGNSDLGYGVQYAGSWGYGSYVGKQKLFCLKELR